MIKRNLFFVSAVRFSKNDLLDAKFFTGYGLYQKFKYSLFKYIN
jgi:hypothetical protein